MKQRELILGLCLISSVTASLSLCSSQNTGSTSAEFNTYQSNGACKDQCSGYAFAIVQGSNCWCSNVEPNDTTDTDDCDESCPGYPSDYCGSEDKSLYGYIQLKQASSTLASSTSTTSSEKTTQESSSTTSSTEDQSSTTSAQSSSVIPETTTSSEEQASSSIASSTSTTSSSTTSSSTTSSSTTASSSTTTSSSKTSSSSKSSTQHSSSQSSSVSPQTSIIYSIKTITGSAETQVATTQIVSTVTGVPSTNASAPSSSDSSDSSSNDNNNKKNGFFDSKAKVGGTFAAVGVVVVALLSTLLYCCFFKKRHQDEEHMTGGAGAIGLDDESANSIQNEKYYDNHNSYGQAATAPTPVGGVVNTSPHTPVNNNRNSEELEVDQRLDPRQMFMNWENGSRKSLADELDYSRRVLRVTNE